MVGSVGSLLNNGYRVSRG